MAETKQKIEEQQQATVQAASADGTQPARPNRDRYAAMFREDNPDVDFEDKEARYERMTKDRDNYRKLHESGKKLSGILNKHRWIGAMLMDDEENPLVWMQKNGIDIRAALDDPEVMQKVTDAFNEWTQKQADGEAAEAAKDAAIEQSVAALDAVQQEFGLSDEQRNRLFEHFWDGIFLPAFAGEVSKDTWVALMHAMNYDTDMQNAREEAAMQARNEKHANRLKTFDDGQTPPPSFSQGSSRPAQKREKKESLRDFVIRNA